MAVSSEESYQVRQRVWLPPRSRGGDAALWMAAALALAAAAAIGGELGTEPGPIGLGVTAVALLLAGAAVGLLVWGVSYRRLAYVLGDDALEVHWLGRILVVPYALVEGIYTGRRLNAGLRLTTPSWPGIYVGRGRAREIGRVRAFATTLGADALTIVSFGGDALVLSSREPLAFRAALIDRVQQQADVPVPDEHARTIPADGPFWSSLYDPVAIWCLAGSLLLVLLGMAPIALAYAGLPERLPLHFDAAGRPNELGFRGDLFRLPIGGAVLALVNGLLGAWLHWREPILARILWIGALVAQIVVFIAVIRLVQ